MQSQFKMPKPSVVDYLIPGLINIKSKRFVSTGIILVLIEFLLIISLLKKPTDAPVFIILVLLFTYLLNYFVCRFQANGKNFVPNFITQAILFYFYIFILIFVSVFVITNPLTQVVIDGNFNVIRSSIWIFILLPLFTFFYYFELSYAGFNLKDFAIDNVTSNYIESSATGVNAINFITKAGFLLFTFIIIGLKIGNHLTNNKFGKFLLDFNSGKVERDFKNSVKVAFVINFAYIFLSLISIILLTILYFFNI